MAANIEIDFTEFNAAINRAYNMGEIRRRDIANVFRTADRPLVRTIKSMAPRSPKGMISKKYPSRSHERGFMKKNIKFKVSKKYKLMYYVNSAAWYTLIYTGGHGSFGGNDFIKRAADQVETQVTAAIKQGLGKLTERVWRNG